MEDDWAPVEDARGEEERAEESRKLEAHSRAVVLEMIGDLPEAEAKPPSDMLFVCKLNPVTTEEVGWTSMSLVWTGASCPAGRDGVRGCALFSPHDECILKVQSMWVAGMHRGFCAAGCKSGSLLGR